MIRLTTGIFLMIATVGFIEGGGITGGAICGFLGFVCMVWGLKGMADKNSDNIGGTIDE